MVTWIKEYVLSIMSVSILGLILDCVIPNGNIKKYASFALSVILSITLLQPFMVELKNKDISLDMDKKGYSVDYTQAVKTTVNSVIGYEQADVFVQQENDKIICVTVKNNKEKLLDKSIQAASLSFLKKLLNAIYGISEDKIFIRE